MIRAVCTAVGFRAKALAKGVDGECGIWPRHDDPAGCRIPAGERQAAGGVSSGSGSPLEPSARLLLQTLRPAPPAGGQQALGWEVLPAQEGDYVSKDGVVGGQCATAAFDPAGRVGVVVLSNTAPKFTVANTSPSGGGVGAADVARHVLRPSIAVGSEQATR